MPRSYIFILFPLLPLLLALSTWASDKPNPNFKINLISEPSSLDPSKISSSQSNYFYSLIFSGLYKYDDQKGLIAVGAESCNFLGPKKLVCDLNKHMKWSDSSPVEASHYVQSFRHLIDPQNFARKPELLFHLKNAKQIFAKKLPPERLGIQALGKYKLQFLFDEPDGDFLYKLSSPVLIPFKTLPSRDQWAKTLYNGTHKIESWKMGKSIKLSPNKMNPHMKSKVSVELLFIEEDSTALRLYNTKYLDLVRRLPASEIPFYKKKSDFIQLPLARFDYIGLSGRLNKDKYLREAMLYAIDYEEFQKLFYSLGRPGCPGIPDSYLSQVPCYKFDLEKAKNLLSKASPESKKLRYKFYFSSAGGEDIRRGVEWFMNQWKKNLGLNIEAVPMEQKMITAFLKKSEADIFRRGVPLDRPTCLAALESFGSNSEENFLKLSNKNIDSMISKLSTSLDIKKDKKLCTTLMKSIFNFHQSLPLGKIHFSLLVNPKFKKWRFNELNQLDLSLLEYSE